MPVFYSYVDLSKNELRNAAVQNLGAAPATPVKGQLYFDTTTNSLYFWDGTTWQVAKGGTGGPPTGAAGGSLTGNYPNPTINTGAVTSAMILDGTITDVDVAAANKDGIATLASLRTVGTGALQAMAGNTTLSSIAAPTASVSLNNQKIVNLLDPSAAQDGATKNYVDNSVAGLAWKAPARVATTVNLAALSGLLTVDGVTVAANDRVLVKNQTTASANGIYVAASGAWTRSTDNDTAAEMLQASMYVEEGTTQSDTQWTCTTNAPITIGSTSLTFVQFSGGGTYTAGNGLSLTGNVFAAVAGTGGINLTAFTTGAAGGVPASGGGTANFLRADGTWAAPPGTGLSKYAAALTGTASPETVTHNLNTQDVVVMVHNGGSPYQFVEVDWAAPTVNTVQITYNPVLGAGYRVVVMG